MENVVFIYFSKQKHYPMRPFMDKDYLVTKDGLKWCVYSNTQPENKTYAVLKNLANGEKIPYRGQQSLKKTIKWLKRKHPEYVSKTSSGIIFTAVPKKLVAKHLSPKKGLKKLLAKGKKTVLEKTVEKLMEKTLPLGISKKKLGITGSLLWGGAKKDSDIDLVVYGRKEAEKISKLLKPTSPKEYYKKYAQKFSNITYPEFLALSKRKKNRGVFNGKKVVIHQVSKKKEKEKKWKNKGTIETKAAVTGDKKSWQTPAEYEIKTKDPVTTKLVIHDPFYQTVFKQKDTIKIKGKLEQSGKQKRITLGSYELTGKEYAKISE